MTFDIDYMSENKAEEINKDFIVGLVDRKILMSNWGYRIRKVRGRK